VVIYPSGTVEPGVGTLCRIESSTGWGEVETVVSVDMTQRGDNCKDLAALIRSIGRADNRIDMKLKPQEMIGRCIPPVVSNSAEFLPSDFHFAQSRHVLPRAIKIQSTSPSSVSKLKSFMSQVH